MSADPIPSTTTTSPVSGEVRHTPGPWHWVIHDVSTASLGVGSDPGMGTPLVMSVSPCRSCIDSAASNEWEWGRCTTPSVADAHLIAAAPELLAALKLVVTRCGPNSEDGKQARAAIAKAEGAAPIPTKEPDHVRRG